MKHSLREAIEEQRTEDIADDEFWDKGFDVCDDENEDYSEGVQNAYKLLFGEVRGTHGAIGYWQQSLLTHIFSLEDTAIPLLQASC